MLDGRLGQLSWTLVLIPIYSAPAPGRVLLPCLHYMCRCGGFVRGPWPFFRPRVERRQVDPWDSVELRLHRYGIV